MASELESQPREAQTLELSDGRILGYAVFGSPPSPGIPVIVYCHGFPTSRVEGSLLISESKDITMTVVAIDRPGMGLSSFQPNRRILDWPRDVLAVLNHLKINRFYVLGDSGGAPFALACAKEVPRTRLLGTAVVSGAYPYSLGMQGMLFPLRVLLVASSWLPTSVTAKILDWEFGGTTEDPEAFEKQFMETIGKRQEKERRCLDDPEQRRVIIGSMKEGYRQGSHGPAYELGLLGNWGFGLEEVDGENVTLWHGRDDVNAPCAMAENATKLIKGCELRIVKEESHTLQKHVRRNPPDIIKRIP